MREAITGGASQSPALAGRVSSGALLSAGGALARLDALPGGKGDGGRGEGGKGGGQKGEGKDAQGEKDADGNTPAAAGANVAGLGGGDSRKPGPEGVRGRPAMRLPALETARRHQPVRPQAPPPVPSTLRNCPPHNPRCNAPASPSPTPTPAQGPAASLTPTSRPGAAVPPDQVYLAAAGGYPLPRLGVTTDLTLMDFMREAAGLSDSDAGTPHLELPRLFAVSHGLLPGLFPAAAQTSHDAEYVSMSVPAAMLAGETYNVSVTMKNTGVTTWNPGESYRLGGQSSTGTAWRLGRVQLPTSVLPTETVTIAFTVTAPTVASTVGYSFRWRMVQDNLEWFGQMTEDRMIPVAAPNYEGAFSSAGCSGITGWAWQAGQPNTPVEVDVFEEVSAGNEIFLARVVAGLCDPALVPAGKGDGCHGFSLSPPAALRDGGTHAGVKVRVANTTFLPGGSPVLTGSPKTVAGCAASPGSTSAPASLVVTPASDTQVNLAWTPAAGATHYRVERALTKSGPYVSLGTTQSASFNDGGRTPGTAYLYRVCAAGVNTNPPGDYCVSPYGNVALATPFDFTDPTLYAGANGTRVRREHVNELRQTVGAVRVAAELGAASWGTALVGTNDPIYASHVRDLRTNLTEALSALNILPPAYTDPTLYAGANGTPVRKAHVEELRLRSTRVSGTVSNQGSQSGTLAAAERLEARNRTGGGGVDLLSGNFNWGLPLLSLRGRAGLDLGLSLSYNSLVWTKSGSTLYFNADEGSPAPGFRLGFPVIQPQYYGTTGTNAYLLVTPSGARVELRQVGSTNAYESADSSYLRLTDGGGGALQLWTTDGTRLSFFRRGSSHYVSEIRDANGNRVSVNHDSQGRLLSVTDTLARTVTFNYDANQNLLSITQGWAGQPHTWATFGYGVATVGDVFSGAVTVSGAQEGQALNVLTQVGLADGSSYRFEYNGYAQVRKVSRHSADNHQLAYTAYDLPANGDDCPRVAARRDWALDWNGELEAITTYNRDAGETWGEMIAPDGTRFRELFATSGWQKGLTTGTETYAGGVAQKYTESSWTQDEEALLYRKNPRVKSTHVWDRDGNHRRTQIDYHADSPYGLVKDVKEFAADATAALEPDKVLRRTHLEYNPGSEYVTSRVIGLVSESRVYGKGASGEELLSKVTYGYDETSADRLVATSTTATPTQHDAAYGTGYSAGRGNLTSMKRWSVTGPFTADNPEYVESKIGYNTTGSVVFTADAEGHKALVSYGDSFSDDINRNTFAYPTAATDPDQSVVEPESQRKRSYTKYHYDMGVATRAEGVSPNEGQAAPAQVFQYDAAGRLQQVTDLVTNAYTRHVYAPGQNWVQTFTTVKDLATEAYSIRVMDGAGRDYASASDHPGSTGLYRGQHTVYDVMGRAVRSSTPAEMTAAWVPAGDDSSGWLYAEQDYDWRGRPTYSRHPDGAINQELIYGGCGCAGGGVVTVRDAVDRRQKSYRDALGRAVKSEVLNTDGTVYSTTTNTYNARDQITRVYEQQGAGGAGQETLMTYDGHGRLATSKAPAQSGPTAYAYYADDATRTRTDPRGATATLVYNKRHLVTGVSHAAPSPIPTPAAVAYGYDAAGNRTSMSDGTGTTAYGYNNLSRMTSETRTFNGLAGSSYTLTYDYSVSGQLKSLTDSFGAVVNYSYDAAGRLLNATGSGAGSAPSYASDLRYRAWGAVKSMTYGNGVQFAAQYDARLRETRREFSGLYYEGQSPVTFGSESEYYADGRVRYARDLRDGDFDRAYDYDHAGRIKEAYSGREARGLPPLQTPDSPLRQSYTYDVWGNMGRTARHWTSTVTDAPTYANDRRADWSYDAGGNVTVSRSGAQTHAYDAAGAKVHYNEENWSSAGLEQYTIEQGYDGVGRPGRRVETRYSWDAQTEAEETHVTRAYYLRSSVLGGAAVAEVDEAGDKRKGHVYAGGEKLAEHELGAGQNVVTWRLADAARGGWVGSGG